MCRYRNVVVNIPFEKNKMFEAFKSTKSITKQIYYYYKYKSNY